MKVNLDWLTIERPKGLVSLDTFAWKQQNDTVHMTLSGKDTVGTNRRSTLIELLNKAGVVSTSDPCEIFKALESCPESFELTAIRAMLGTERPEKNLTSSLSNSYVIPDPNE